MMRLVLAGRLSILLVLAILASLQIGWKDAAKASSAITDASAESPLLVALKERCDSLASAGQINGRPNGNDITDLTERFIPPGTDFEAAERLLREAGFTIVHPDLVAGEHDVNRPADWYGVTASIRPYRQDLFSQSMIGVTLLPFSPGCYTKIEKVTGTILNMFP